MNTHIQKTKILFVITKSNWGGAQKYVYDLATGLPKNRFEAVVALGGEGLLFQKLQDARIRTVSAPSLLRDIKIFQDIKSLFFLWRLFRAEHPDVVHLNSSKAGAIGALASRLARVPKIIFTAHGWAWNENRGWLERMAIKFIAGITVLMSHKTIAVSNAILCDMNFPGTKKRMVVIKNGVNPVDFLSREEARRQLSAIAKTDIPLGAFLLGTVAELHSNKGLTYGIEGVKEIMRKHPNLYWIIIGEGEERKKLEILIEEAGLINRIFLAGFVDNVSRYLKAFDAFLLPSITEALPFVILDAGLASLPVIATKVGGIPEIIEGGKTGLLVPKKDSSAIAGALECMISNPSARKEYGKSLCDKILLDFSLNRTLEESIALYTNK
ncbi:MAG: glycosyltransferase family 4 protein [Candidatus Pacebacteria bacterium]|nr:glycosyltransferase family 4 protein [Candidatus Paceibacterota bacterium]